MPQRLDASSLPELEGLYRTFFAVQADFATALPSKGIAVDKQANDDVVHLHGFREADGLTDQALHRS